MSLSSSPALRWGGLGLGLVLVGLGAWVWHGRAQPQAAHQPLIATNTPGFRDVTTSAGIHFLMSSLPDEQGHAFKINLYDHGCGVAVGDFDGDGHDDIYFVNQLGKNALYRNKGNGTFEDVTDNAGVGLGDRICVAATWADYDNSGRQSLFVTSTRGGNVLFKNMGDGTFRDVTRQAGLTYVGHSQTAVFFDFDNDGYLDLFVTNTANWTENQQRGSRKYFPGVSGLSALANSRIEANKLYRNNHDGTFTDVTKKARLEGKGWGGDVAVFDYDGDGWSDLLVTNMFGASQLYHNNGDGTFTDVTKKTLGRTSWGAIGSKVFDYDNDGRLDLLIVDMHSDMWAPSTRDAKFANTIAERYAHKKFRSVTGPQANYSTSAEQRETVMAALFNIKYDDVLFGNTLFHNLGQGKFQEVSDSAGMETFWPWGIATGDFNNDGFEDVFLPSGMGYPWFYWPNALMMNNGNGTFTDRAATAGIEPPTGGIYQLSEVEGEPAPRSSRCAAVADFDGDGRLDLVVNNFNSPAYYFKNQFPRQNFITFRLQGTRCNRDAIGAIVRLHAGNRVMVRQVNPAGGYLSQASKTVHFGLGKVADVDRVEIFWPGQKQPQVLPHPAVNRLHQIMQAGT